MARLIVKVKTTAPRPQESDDTNTVVLMVGSTPQGDKGLKGDKWGDELITLVDNATNAANSAAYNANTTNTIAIGLVDNLTNQTIDFVNDAINNTAVEGGVLADTFVTATKKTSTAVARSMRDVNGDIVSILDFYDPIATPNNHTAAFNNAITYVSSLGGGTVHVPDGIFKIDPTIGVKLKNNIEIRGGINSTVEALPYTVGKYSIFHIEQLHNVVIRDLIIDGRRDLRIAPNSGGQYYKDYKEGITYSVGDYTTIHSKGVEALSSGTYERIEYSAYISAFHSKGVGDIFTHGGVQFKVVEDNVGEWGNGIDALSSKNITLDNLKIQNCWGDAIFFGRTLDWASDLLYNTTYLKYTEGVLANNLVLSNNRRQGMSILSLKDATFNKVSIYDTHGTAPECAIDFEPEEVNDKLTNIVFNDLVTYNNRSAGVAVSLRGFYNVHSEQTRDRLVNSGHGVNNYPTVIDAAVLDGIKEGQDNNKISITFNNWQNRNGNAYYQHGAVSGKPRGFVKILNSYLVAEGGDTADGYTLGAVYNENTHRNHPKIIIEDTTLHGKTLNQRSMVYSNVVTQHNTPSGGFYLKNIKFILDKPTTDAALISIRNTTKTTQDFADILIDNCYQYPENPEYIADIGGTITRDILPTNVNIRNIGAGFTRTIKQTYENVDNSNMQPLRLNREDNDIVFINVNVPYFAHGVGTHLELKNDLCATGSDKYLVFRTSSKIEGLEWSLNSSYAQEIVVAPQGKVILEVLGAKIARIVNIDPTSLNATKSKYYYAVDSLWNDVAIYNLGANEIFSLPLSIHAGADWSATAAVFKGVLPRTLQYNVISQSNGDYLLEIKNISTTEVTYVGKVKITTM